MLIQLFPSCGEAARRISIRLDTILTGPARAGLWIHLAVCRHCRRYAHQIGLLHSAMGRYPDQLDRLQLSSQRRHEIIARLLTLR